MKNSHRYRSNYARKPVSVRERSLESETAALGRNTALAMRHETDV